MADSLARLKQLVDLGKDPATRTLENFALILKEFQTIDPNVSTKDLAQALVLGVFYVNGELTNKFPDFWPLSSLNYPEAKLTLNRELTEAIATVQAALKDWKVVHRPSDGAEVSVAHALAGLDCHIRAGSLMGMAYTYGGDAGKYFNQRVFTSDHGKSQEELHKIPGSITDSDWRGDSMGGDLSNGFDFLRAQRAGGKFPGPGDTPTTLYEVLKTHDELGGKWQIPEAREDYVPPSWEPPPPNLDHYNQQSRVEEISPLDPSYQKSVLPKAEQSTSNTTAQHQTAPEAHLDHLNQQSRVEEILPLDPSYQKSVPPKAEQSTSNTTAPHQTAPEAHLDHLNQQSRVEEILPVDPSYQKSVPPKAESSSNSSAANPQPASIVLPIDQADSPNSQQRPAQPAVLGGIGTDESVLPQTGAADARDQQSHAQDLLREDTGQNQTVLPRTNDTDAGAADQQGRADRGDHNPSGQPPAGGSTPTGEPGGVDAPPSPPDAGPG